ncbi:hypothetical protein KAM463_21470 [Aeromonas caviae]|uniref:Uncharacterized protein n=2 Tax=Aeromonas caviae TaxID=648 RepID=A0AAW9F1G5_AERCA|nr:MULTISPECIES: hypothetical protein [Aeromonas]KIQ79684.1 hypothetical protein RW26_14360 [Aeromonas sp. L_1B5_3]MDX7721145.1 hypothetical protein [Aeromonas caviae]GKR06582.1 hypothetical protein KAM463_21470 [Aeromonas caviae]
METTNSDGTKLRDKLKHLHGAAHDLKNKLLKFKFISRNDLLLTMRISRDLLRNERRLGAWQVHGEAPKPTGLPPFEVEKGYYVNCPKILMPARLYLRLAYLDFRRQQYEQAWGNLTQASYYIGVVDAAFYFLSLSKQAQAKRGGIKLAGVKARARELLTELQPSGKTAEGGLRGWNGDVKSALNAIRDQLMLEIQEGKLVWDFPKPPKNDENLMKRTEKNLREWLKPGGILHYDFKHKDTARPPPTVRSEAELCAWWDSFSVNPMSIKASQVIKEHIPATKQSSEYWDWE